MVSSLSRLFHKTDEREKLVISCNGSDGAGLHADS